MMNTSELVPVMNDTKWDELRLAMYSLGDLHPKWRTKDVENGFIPEWDGEWFHHFRQGGYASIEWAEIRITSPEQDNLVRAALISIHVPGVKTGDGYRIYGYTKPGQKVEYLD
jgi:hypothetical protein